MAALNAPSLTVVSGDHAAIAAFEARLTARELACRRLATSHAFHSPMMEPILEELRRGRAPRCRAPRRRAAGSRASPATDHRRRGNRPAYWAQQLRQPVRFMDGVGKLMDPNRVLLEVGPGQALTSLARQHPVAKPSSSCSPRCIGARTADLDDLLAAAGRLWTAGVAIDWSAFHGRSRRRRISASDLSVRAARLLGRAGRRDRRIPTTRSPQPRRLNPRRSRMTMPNRPLRNPAADRSAPMVERLQALFADLSGIDAATLDPAPHSSSSASTRCS